MKINWLLALLILACGIFDGVYAAPNHLAKKRKVTKTTTKTSNTNSGATKTKTVIKIAFNEKKNYIVNGDFQTPVVETWKSILAAPWTDAINNDLLEIGKGTIYNKKWNTGQVCELDGGQNSAVSQKIQLEEGKFKLVFDHANRQKTSYKSNQFSVYWNGKLVKAYLIEDYDLHHEQMLVDAVNGTNTLEFRGSGESDGYGHTIDNVAVYARLYKGALRTVSRDRTVYTTRPVTKKVKRQRIVQEEQSEQSQPYVMVRQKVKRRKPKRKVVQVEQEPQTQQVAQIQQVQQVVEEPQPVKVQQKIKYVEKRVEVPVQKIVQKIVEVPVEKIVQKIVEVPVQKIVQKRVQVPVQKIVEKVVQKRVQVPVQKIVQVPVQKIVQKRVQVPVQKIVKVPVEKIVQKIVEKPVDKIIRVPVDKIVQKIVEKPVDRIVQKIVYKKVEVPVERIVQQQIDKVYLLPIKVQKKVIPVEVEVPLGYGQAVYVGSNTKFFTDNNHSLHNHSVITTKHSHGHDTTLQLDAATLAKLTNTSFSFNSTSSLHNNDFTKLLLNQHINPSNILSINWGDLKNHINTTEVTTVVSTQVPAKTQATNTKTTVTTVNIAEQVPVKNSNITVTQGKKNKTNTTTTTTTTQTIVVQQTAQQKAEQQKKKKQAQKKKTVTTTTTIIQQVEQKPAVAATTQTTTTTVTKQEEKTAQQKPTVAAAQTTTTTTVTKQEGKTAQQKPAAAATTTQTTTTTTVTKQEGKATGTQEVKTGGTTTTTTVSQAKS